MNDQKEMREAAKTLGMELSAPFLEEETGKFYSKLRLRIGPNLLRAVRLAGGVTTDPNLGGYPKEDELRIYLDPDFKPEWWANKEM